jgi:hypothetical protein
VKKRRGEEGVARVKGVDQVHLPGSDPFVPCRTCIGARLNARMAGSNTVPTYIHANIVLNTCLSKKVTKKKVSGALERGANYYSKTEPKITYENYVIFIWICNKVSECFQFYHQQVKPL